MIPMGTVVTVCMILAVIFANRFPGFGVNRVCPRWLLQAIGVLVGLAGVWNVFWYGLRHLTEPWGVMALVSGVLMMFVAALLLLHEKQTPAWMQVLRPFAVLLLAACAAYYGMTIMRL